MATLTLYDNPGSSNALKARFALALLDLDYEKIDVQLTDPRPDWLLAVNPFGTVPVLRDGDDVIIESNTILRYLAAREGRRDLYPDEPLARARVDEVMDAWSMSVRPVARPVEVPALFGPTPDHAKVAAATPAYVEMLDRVERLVRGEGSLCAGGLTVADCCAAPTLFRAAKLDLPWERWPRLAAARDAVLAHPAFLAAGPVR